MNRHRAIIFAIAALVLAAMVGFMAYNAGVQHGIMQSGKVIAAPGAPPGAYPYPYYGWHPWGFGFFFAPLFFFFVFFAFMRMLFWRGHYHHRRYGCDYRQQPEGGAPQQ